LYDSLGVATGYSFAIGWHTIPVVEHDHWESWPQRVELITPDLTVVQANVDGSMDQDVFFEGTSDGDADDDDGDGEDEVVTELMDLNLTGNSVLGPLSVRLNPSFASTGEIEETSDIVTGWLDVSPFTAGGTAVSIYRCTIHWAWLRDTLLRLAGIPFQWLSTTTGNRGLNVLRLSSRIRL
jgi:hypothetical protein